jgi:sulfotransferase
MASRFHFISGLPRSGSTLLAALLRQNPRFHAAMMSPVAGLVGNLLAQCRAGSEFASLISTAQRRNLAHGIFASYYQDIGDKPVVFDTNRGWCGRLGLIRDLYPEAKVVCCVRNVAWILDSLERLYRADPYEYTRLFDSDHERGTVYTRTRALTGSNRLVGHAWQALKEAYYGEHSEMLLIVDYELLSRRPAPVMRLIYRFLDEEPFAHDFERVDYSAPAFDEALGVPRLHTVAPRVAFRPRRTVLPPDLFRDYADLAFWRDPAGTRAQVVVLKRAANAGQGNMPAEAVPAKEGGLSD